ncbi:MAG: N-formylglutamate amidohydrolase [Paracoccaceae bacterium]
MSWGTHDSRFGEAVSVLPAPLDAPVLLVCEHASNFIPEPLDNLGLTDDVRHSHIAWDPGALGVSTRLAEHMNAPLVAGCVSRLVYDCNRPPTAHDAVPARSEIYDVPGNQNLTKDALTQRATEVYVPFRDCLSAEIARRPMVQILVTIHSFTPIYNGTPREVGIGILHGDDDRFASQMMSQMPASDHLIELNQPYGPSDGVAHTLNLHGAQNGLLNVMIEIRNDLITSPKDQAVLADMLAPWIEGTHKHIVQEAMA